ncbi:DUF455-domain-containing protein [Mycena indigotica]|uniref:DUF455-domain-containing protein n=1 Tax=Mycena indigotica TaxID=2126181 RepID=A0A8H6VQV8_9AGAR|nr:DUF455-domain-containing protein [Mycena indigotica]KAF7290702.1 DUF455-domain-containing protein [Mycena indigotica]
MQSARFIRISSFKNLLTHSRFTLTLRSDTGKYHSLILFRLSVETEKTSSERLEKNNAGQNRQIYVMESSCPHLGADMSHADIEEYEDTGATVAVCPWHRYDFDLRTGKSETGLRTCTYAVEVKTDPEDDVEMVYVETPSGGNNWRLVDIRPVSEEFADPPPTTSLPVSQVNPVTISISESLEPVVPDLNPPRTLMQWAVLILNTANPTLKVLRTRHAVHMFRTGKLDSIGHKSASAPKPPDVPPREDSYLRNTVNPGKVKGRRSLAVMLHALANIEQWAIDLSWDIIARFGPSHPDLPHAFFSDFTKMALDESKHFSLLTSRLSATSPTTPYGTMPVHASLWESATITSHSLRSRLAIIHLVHEARGLDVNPGTIERFRRAGDKDSVAALEIIHADEVTHVTSGHRWFTWLCEREQGVDPITTFREEVRRGWRGNVKGPFNIEAREQAGLTREFYEDLEGEMEDEEMVQRLGGFRLNDLGGMKAQVEVQYDRGINHQRIWSNSVDFYPVKANYGSIPCHDHFLTMADPVAEKSGFLKTYMSSHPDTLVAYAKWYGKVTENLTSAEMSAIDTKSMTLTCTLKDGSKKVAVVAIDPPLRNYDDVKPRLLEMKAIAQEGLGMIKTPRITVFKWPSWGIPFGIWLYTFLPYGAFAPVGDAPYLIPAQFIRQFISPLPFKIAFGFTVGLHFLESLYTLYLCQKHRAGYEVMIAYWLSTMIFGMPVWKGLRRRIQKARIESVMKIE